MGIHSVIQTPTLSGQWQFYMGTEFVSFVKKSHPMSEHFIFTTLKDCTYNVSFISMVNFKVSLSQHKWYLLQKHCTSFMIGMEHESLLIMSHPLVIFFRHCILVQFFTYIIYCVVCLRYSIIILILVEYYRSL